MNRTIRNAALTTLALIGLTHWGGAAAQAQVTFTNSTTIIINDDPTGAGDANVGIATPYPSPISVTGLVGVIAEVTVTLHDLDHRFLRDIDILLVAPDDTPGSETDNRRTLIMSDVGGGGPGTNGTPITLTFDDDSPNSILFGTVPSSGVYKPSNDATSGEEPDTFPTLPHDVSRPVSLSTFDGHTGNGIWRLFVVDDGSGSTGQILNGWSLTLTMANVPEPGALPLLFCGLLTGGTVIARRRRG